MDLEAVLQYVKDHGLDRLGVLVRQLQDKVPIYGSGSPEGVVEARVGKTYIDEDGGAGATFYVKETGTGDTGWAAK